MNIVIARIFTQVSFVQSKHCSYLEGTRHSCYRSAMWINLKRSHRGGTFYTSYKSRVLQSTKYFTSVSSRNTNQNIRVSRT